MNKHTIRLPTLHPTQRLLLTHAGHRNVVAMGEQGGKTTLAVELLVASARGALRTSAPVVYLAPTAEDVRACWRLVRQAVDSLIGTNSNRRQIGLSNGNAIHFYALDELKGKALPEQYGLMVVDDASAADELLALWDDSLSLALRQHQGQAWFLSTPFGKRNDFWRLYCRADSNPSWHS